MSDKQLTEFRVRWQQCPHDTHPIGVLFIKAENAEAARVLAKDHVERTIGVEWFSVYEAKPTAALPAGSVLRGSPAT